MSTGYLVWAAKGQASPEEQLFVLALLGVAILFAIAVGAAAGANTTVHVNLKNGVPYCPVCNRQVSYRRDHCRTCGYQFRRYEKPQPAPRVEPVERDVPPKTLPPPAPKQPPPPPPPHVIERDRRRKEARERRLRDLEARGITPGPTAWFWMLPDWAQPIVLGAGGSAFFLLVMWVAYRLAG